MNTQLKIIPLQSAAEWFTIYNTQFPFIYVGVGLPGLPFDCVVHFLLKWTSDVKRLEMIFPVALQCMDEGRCCLLGVFSVVAISPV